MIYNHSKKWGHPVLIHFSTSAITAHIMGPLFRSIFRSFLLYGPQSSTRFMGQYFWAADLPRMTYLPTLYKDVRHQTWPATDCPLLFQVFFLLFLCFYFPFVLVFLYFFFISTLFVVYFYFIPYFLLYEFAPTVNWS